MDPKLTSGRRVCPIKPSVELLTKTQNNLEKMLANELQRCVWCGHGVRETCYGTFIAEVA